MIQAKGYAAQNENAALAHWSFERRDVGPGDILIDIAYCGVCHSDLHQVRNEWGRTIYPIVPGHEIVGVVADTGKDVTRFKKGDAVGVGCLVDSCRTCSNCLEGEEQYCLNGNVGTYNSYGYDGKPTYGGYSNNIVVSQDFVLHIPDTLPLAATAPLLCAGITTYSPLRHWQVGAGHRVGILGLGGLGHMGVKWAASFGAEVTVLSTSSSKKADAQQLGAHHFRVTADKDALKEVRGYFDFILDTVSAEHDYSLYLSLLKKNGVHICVGAPPVPGQLSAFSLINGRRSLAGSLIGGIRETQEMLDYCGAHNIVSEIELIGIQDVDKAYERMLKGDVRYRFVIDMSSL